MMDAVSMSCARLFGFIRVLHRPPAFVLPLFNYVSGSESSDYCLVSQQISEEDRIAGFLKIQANKSEIVALTSECAKAVGDECLMVYEVDYGTVLIGERDILRKELLSHLNSDVFVRNVFSAYQAAKFCRSAQAMAKAISRMQIRLMDAPHAARYILRNVLIRDEIDARARERIKDYGGIRNSFRLVEDGGRIEVADDQSLNTTLNEIITETLAEFEAQHPFYGFSVARNAQRKMKQIYIGAKPAGAGALWDTDASRRSIPPYGSKYPYGGRGD